MFCRKRKHDNALLQSVWKLKLSDIEFVNLKISGGSEAKIKSMSVISETFEPDQNTTFGNIVLIKPSFCELCGLNSGSLVLDFALNLKAIDFFIHLTFLLKLNVCFCII